MQQLVSEFHLHVFYCNGICWMMSCQINCSFLTPEPFSFLELCSTYDKFERLVLVWYWFQELHIDVNRFTDWQDSGFSETGLVMGDLSMFLWSSTLCSWAGIYSCLLFHWLIMAQSACLNTSAFTQSSHLVPFVDLVTLLSFCVATFNCMMTDDAIPRDRVPRGGNISLSAAPELFMPLQSFHFCERTPLKGVVLFLDITCHQLSAKIRTWCFTSF